MNTKSYLGVLEKMKRAEKHINEFYEAAEIFGKSCPNSVATKTDDKTGNIAYYITEVPIIPPHLIVILGDVLQNLRSALDHLAYGLVTANKGTPTRQTGFPIFDSAATYEKGSPAKVKRMRQEAIDAINLMHPYKGGNNKLWELHELNIRDKHRLLLALAFVNDARTKTPSEIEASRIGNEGGVPVFPIGRWMFTSYMRGKPIEIGDVLLTVPPSEAKENMSFSLGIAMNEIGVLKGTPIGLYLPQLTAFVQFTITSLLDYL
jgi:hypothetical protein